MHRRLAPDSCTKASPISFIDKFLGLASSIKLGDPLDPATEMGPLTSAQHRDRVMRYCKIAVEEGGKMLLGGSAPSRTELAAGCYVEPTVVQAKAERPRVAGGSVRSFRHGHDIQDRRRGAGDRQWQPNTGLGGGLWTSNLQRAHRFAHAMRSGMVWINCYKRVNPGSPFGGVGASGYGREMGFEAMHQYTEVKSVWVNVDANFPPYYPRQTNA